MSQPCSLSRVVTRGNHPPWLTPNASWCQIQCWFDSWVRERICCASTFEAGHDVGLQAGCANSTELVWDWMWLQRKYSSMQKANSLLESWTLNEVFQPAGHQQPDGWKGAIQAAGSDLAPIKGDENRFHSWIEDDLTIFNTCYQNHLPLNLHRQS